MSQAGGVSSGGGGGGDVVGPGASTDNALVRWDGTSGTMIKDGIAIETDGGQIQAALGDITTPTYSFLGADNSGMFTNGTDTFIVGNGVAGLYSGFNSGMAGNTNTIANGVIYNAIRTEISDYTVAFNDHLILVDTSTFSAPINISLMVSPITGQEFEIKDASGSASNFNINIIGNIDGAGSYVINQNYGSVTLIYNGTQWNAVGSVNASSGIGGSTGSTDRAIIIADGTGGSTVQGSLPTITSGGAILAPDGLDSAPTYSFTGDPSVGLARSGTGINFDANNVTAFSYSDTGIRTSVPLTTANPLLLLYGYGIVKTSTPVSSPYVVDDVYDYLITVNTSSAYTIQLPDSSITGVSFIIKDATGTGAATNNITVTTVSGTTLIDGSTSYVINTTRASVTVVFSTSLGAYLVI